MIEKWADLELHEDPETKALENFESTVDVKIQEKLGVSLSQLREKISAYVVEQAPLLAEDFANIAPLGDYSELIEDPEAIIQFLKTEASKVEHWKLSRLEVSPIHSDLLVFEFNNKSIDEGNICSGFAYVSFQGKIKHAFAQGDV